jgi:hypothetical protein
MKLYLLEQSDTTELDKYDSCVVCAENEEDAKTIHPNGGIFIINKTFSSWVVNTESIICKEIGKATKDLARGVICASFNAG